MNDGISLGSLANEVRLLQTEVGNLRGEAPLLRHLLAELIQKWPDGNGMQLFEDASIKARAPLGESVINGQANPPRIALENARNKLLTAMGFKPVQK